MHLGPLLTLGKVDGNLLDAALLLFRFGTRRLKLQCINYVKDGHLLHKHGLGQAQHWMLASHWKFTSGNLITAWGGTTWRHAECPCR